MDNDIKKLFEYLREIYQLKTKIITDYKKYDKEIDIVDFKNTYEPIGETHIFSKDISENEEYFVLKYITQEKDFPKIPEEIKDYIDIHEKGIQLKEEVDISDEIIKLFNQYKNDYNNVKRTNGLIEKYNELYEFFYEINKRKEEFEEKIEVLLCKGLFVYKQNETNYTNLIKRHIFEVPLTIDIKQDENIIYLRIDKENKCNLEYNFISAIQGFKMKDQSELLKLKSEIEDSYVENETINFEELYKNYLNNISFKNEYVKDSFYSEIEENKCYIFNKDNIVIRKKQPTVWYEDLNEIVKRIEEGKFETGNILPQLILETEEERITELLFSKQEEQRILFPLASNEEQYKVVRQTQNSNLVLVQGPPGTGKSHTIANLISNYVAEGKRVLITSEKAKALEVIKEKLPSEIQNLSMTILSEAKNDSDLSNSIQIVLDRYKDKEYLQDYLERIETLEKKLDENNMQKVQKQKEIIDVLLNSTKDIKEEIKEIVPIELENYMLIDVAKYLSNNRELDYIKDVNNLANVSSFNKEFLLELNTIVKELKQYKNFIIQREYNLPEDLELDKYQESIESINKVKNTEEIEYFLKEGINETVLANYDITLLMDVVKKVIELEEIYNKAYIKENCNYTPRIKNIQSIIQNCKEDKEFFEKAETNLIGNVIEYNPKNRNKLNKALDKVNEKLANDGKISLIEKMQIYKELEVVSEIKINNHEFKEGKINQANMELVLQRIQYDIKVNKIKEDIKLVLKESNIWDNVEELEFSRYVDFIINLLETFINYNKYITNIKQAMKDIFKDNAKVQQDIQEENYTQLYDIIKKTNEYQEYVNAKKKYDEQLEAIQQKSVKVFDIFENLLNAIEEKDLKKYIEERIRIEKIYDIDREYKKLKEKYVNETSYFTQFINDYIEWEEEERRKVIKSFEDILNYYKLKMYFYYQELGNQKFNDLLQQKETLQKEEKRIIVKLIEEKSWYNQINNMDNVTCRALSQWLTLKTKLGKGTGKRANLIRKEMQEQMQKAKDAIPIWIMPVDKVVEQYPFSIEPQFDVVIMDESSQSSITSITALLRGKRVIVVGDDKQISPISVGISVNDINLLQNKYLKDTCLGVGFNMETSIYDLTQNICGSKKVVLKEHFRCLPEIIEFSNLNFYGNQINCLKVRNKDNTIKEPIKTEFVKEGLVKRTNSGLVNQKEIDKIMELLKDIQTNNDYNNKTIGIIVLQNSSAQLNAITSEIWKNFNSDFVKNRKLKIGTTYDFQGDERDVIILSMVTSKLQEDGEINRIMALTKKEFERSYNVATSRAKEQVILVYSVALEDLNKECLRYKLISYYTNYNSEKELAKEKLFESDFEKDVYKMLKTRGIELIPQFKVGKYRIDFVVENANGKRVAIECDGDKYHTIEDYEKDIERQDVLERCGWKFIRIRASQYYYNQDKTINKIIKQLEEFLHEDNKELNIHKFKIEKSNDDNQE